MTLKPPTKTFPKLVMKEWPEKEFGPGPFEEMLNDQYWEQALSDLLEGVEGQKETPLRKQESDHD